MAKITYLSLCPPWPLGVPDIKCLQLLAPDTKEWKWARREGLVVSLVRTKLGAHQDKEFPGNGARVGGVYPEG